MEARFEALVPRIIDAIRKDGGNDEVVKVISARLRAEFANPRAEDLEKVTGIPFTKERARALLFFPRPSDDEIGLYPKLICSPPDGAPEEHPQTQIQLTFMAVLSIWHSRDGALMRDFILNDGMLALAGLVAHPNMYLRSQAHEVLLHCTSESTFDWFQPPQTRMT